MQFLHIFTCKLFSSEFGSLLWALNFTCFNLLLSVEVILFQDEFQLRSAQSSLGSDVSRSRIHELESRVHELQLQNQQLRDVNSMVTEQLTRTEKQHKQLLDRDVVPRQEYRRLAQHQLVVQVSAHKPGLLYMSIGFYF